MPEAGFNIDGTPEWIPDVSLQTVTARDKARKAPKGADRDRLVDDWLTSAELDLEISIKGYRQFLQRETKPTKMLRKKDREAAAYWLPRLGTIGAVESWWRQRLRANALEWRQQD